MHLVLSAVSRAEAPIVAMHGIQAVPVFTLAHKQSSLIGSHVRVGLQTQEFPAAEAAVDPERALQRTHLEPSWKYLETQTHVFEALSHCRFAALSQVHV